MGPIQNQSLFPVRSVTLFSLNQLTPDPRIVEAIPQSTCTGGGGSPFPRENASYHVTQGRMNGLWVAQQQVTVTGTDAVLTEPALFPRCSRSVIHPSHKLDTQKSPVTPPSPSCLPWLIHGQFLSAGPFLSGPSIFYCSST